MKKIVLGYIALFLVLCVLPLLLMLLGVGRTTAEFEQRELAEKPEFSIAGISDYPSSFESFYNDRLPFRAQLIRANNRINFATLSGSSALTLIQGRDGWLFYNPAGLDGDPVGDYYNDPRLPDEQLAEIAQALVTMRDQLAESGCEFVFYLAPNKLTLYADDYFPFYYPRNAGQTRGQQLAEFLAQMPELRTVYPEQALRDAVSDRLPVIYYRQDTHWNTAGGYVGAKALLETLGIPMPELETLTLREAESDIRDLGLMLSVGSQLPRETDYIPEGYATRQIREEKMDGIVRTACPGGDSRKLMVIRDSFCTAMIDPIASQFENCVFVQRKDFSPSLLREEQPDILVYECVERFLTEIPSFRLR